MTSIFNDTIGLLVINVFILNSYKTKKSIQEYALLLDIIIRKINSSFKKSMNLPKIQIIYTDSPKKDLIVNHNIFLITLVDHRIVLSIQQSRFNLVNNANEIISQGNYGSQSFYDQHRNRQKRNNNPTNVKVSYIFLSNPILHFQLKRFYNR